MYTATAFDQMRPFPVPVRTTLTLLTSIKQSVPRAERIWKASNIWKGGVGERFAKLLEAERELRQGLDAGSGRWTLLWRRRGSRFRELLRSRSTDILVDARIRIMYCTK